MGLFSSDKKYLAFAATGDLIPPEERADTLTNSLLQASKANEDITSAIKFAIGTDLGARAAAMIKYAAKDGGYIRGLPTSDQPNFSIPEGVLLPALERAAGEPILEAPWLFIGGPDESFLLDKHIQAAYLDPAYFPWPSGAPSIPVWDENLEFIEIPVVDPSTGSYYVTENEPTYIRNEYQGPLDFDDLQEIPGDLYAQLEYADVYVSQYSFGFSYTDNLGEVQTWISPALLDLTAYEGKTLIQVRYSTEANPLVVDYWVYEIGSNEDPELEAGIEANSVQNNFMPVAIMMQDRVWFNEEEDSELHKTTNKLLKKLAVKGDEIREDFEQQEADDLASGEAKKRDPEKWDFFIHFAAPVMSKTRGTLEYLYYFFLEMEKNQQHTFEDYQRYLASRSEKRNGYDLPQPISEIKITEGGVNGYNMRLGWSYIYSETFPGKFIGDANKELRINHFDSDLYQRLPENDAKYKVGLEEMHGSGILLGKARVEEKEKTHKNGYHDYVIYTMQHYNRDTDTWSHTRVLCMGLSMEYTINTRETAEGDKGYRFRYAEPHIFDINEETGEYLNGFRIPIHIGILENDIRKLHHEELMQDSLSATVFLVKEISIPWYQTGFWKWLIVIIAIILIVLSIIYAGGAGSTEASSLIGAIVSGVGATGLWAFVLYVVLSFAFGFIIGLASQTIAQEFGKTAGMLFAIFAAIAMAGGFSGDFSLSNYFPGFDTWGSAQVTLSSTLAVTNTGLQIYQTHALSKLQADLRDFMMTQREKMQELQEVRDQLGPPGDDFDLWGYMEATDRGATGEYPQDYLNRTLNANPGLLGYDFVYNFIPLSLMLPDRPGQMGPVEAQYLAFEKQKGAA